MSDAYIIFDVVENNAAISVVELVEILPVAQFIVVPGMSALLAGILYVDNTSIPVIPLNRLIGLPDSDPQVFASVLLIKTSRLYFGLLVDRVIRLVRAVAAPTVVLPSNHTFNNCATGGIEIDGTIIPVLSAQRVLLESESRQIAEFQAREQRRMSELGETAA